MPANLTTTTCSYLSGNKYGINTKTLYNSICNLSPVIETVEVADDSDSSYSAYFRFSWATNIVFCIRNSSSSLHLESYRKDDSGTILICGENYIKVNSIHMNSFLSSSNVHTIYALETENDFLNIIMTDGSHHLCFSVSKYIELCSKEEFICYGTGGSSSDGCTPSLYGLGISDAVLSKNSLIYASVHNSYLKVCPVLVNGSGKMLTRTTPLDYVIGYTSQSGCFAPLTEFTVDGQKFFAENSTFAIRIN